MDKTIKDQVRKYYSRLAQKFFSGGRNAVTAPCLAGYEESSLAGVPAAAVEKSFGCGDPLSFAGVEPGQTVLDIGSGAGIDCFIASGKVGPAGKVIGLDMTPAMLEAARRNAAKGGHANVEFRQGEAEHMPVEDGIVDWVISNCVINLSPDKEKVFAEIHRVLKPGGRILISDIVADSLPDRIRQDQLSYCGCIGGAIPESDYLGLLARAGLADLRIESRLEYSPEQVRGMVSGDQELKRRYGAPLEAEPGLLSQVKIASIQVSGRKPAVGGLSE